MKEESKKRKRDDDDYAINKYKKTEISPQTKLTKSSSSLTYFPMSERQQYALFKQMEDDSPSSSLSKEITEGVAPTACHQSENVSTVTNVSSSIPSSSIYNISGDKKNNKRNGTGETPLIQMAKKGDLNSIRVLVSEGSNVNEQDYAGWTALHECSIRNYPQITHFLLRHGADVNLAGLHGDTPLHDAVRNSCPEVVRLLLKYGADPRRMNDKRIRPTDLVQTDEISKILYEAITNAKAKKSRQQLIPGNSNPESVLDSAQQSVYLDHIKSYQTQSISSSESAFLEEQSSNSSDTTNEKNDVKESCKDPYAFEDEEIAETSSFNVSPHKITSSKSGKSKVSNSSLGQYTEEPGNVIESIHLSSPSQSRSHSSSPKVPPLRIKICSHTNPSERQISEDSQPPSLEDSTCGSKNKNNFGDKTNFSDSESSLISMDISINKSTPEPTKSIKYNCQESTTFDSSAQMSPASEVKEEVSTKDEATIDEEKKTIKEENVDLKDESKLMLSFSSKRGTGRTLRSHTVAAQKEKKDKEKVDCAPIKKRKFKSRSDSTASDKTVTCTFSSNQASSSNTYYNKASVKLEAVNDISLSNTANIVCDDKILMSPSKSEYWDNPYRKAFKLHRHLNSLLFNLEVVHPKAPVGYQDFLLTTKKYLLADHNTINTAIKKRNLPSDIKRVELINLFKDHEEVRYNQALKHQTEREHLRLVAEQEVIRAQNKAARQLAGQDRPFSFCSAIAYKDYTYIPSSLLKCLEENKNQNSESEKGEQFSYENFINSLKTLKDKFELEKKKVLTRQLHESESLKMVQQMDWELKLKEMFLEDINEDPSLKRMSLEHVPMTDVPNDFTLFTTDPFQISGCVPN